jgi:hypothetical protein
MPMTPAASSGGETPRLQRLGYGLALVEPFDAAWLDTACVADHFGSVVVGEGACLGEAGGFGDAP